MSDIPLPEPNFPESASAAPAAGQVPVQTIVLQQRGGGLAKFLAWTGWLGLLLCVPVILGLLVVVAVLGSAYGPVTPLKEEYHSLSKTAKTKIAIITVEGVIMETDGYIKKQIDQARNDPNVKGIVLRVDSPGGSMTASDYLYHYLVELREKKDVPIVVSMGGLAASGGYYLSMAVGDREKSIYAEPATWTGSIGVIIPHYDLSGLLEEWNVQDDSIKSHPRKQMLSMTRPMTPEDREILQQLVDTAFTQFKDVVKAGRPVFQKDSQILNDLATGEVYTAEQAKNSGLIDEIGYIEDAIERVLDLTNLNKESVRVVRYAEPPTLIGALGVSERAMQGDSTFSDLLDASAPRAYYLFTTLPAWMKNQ